MTSKSQVKRQVTQGNFVKLPAKLKPSEIDWSVIVFMHRPDLSCAVCHASGCAWAACTKKDRKPVPLCFGCGEDKDG